jgi:hypothetical protein
MGEECLPRQTPLATSEHARKGTGLGIGGTERVNDFETVIVRI